MDSKKKSAIVTKDDANSFKVLTYSSHVDDGFCYHHWSEGLKMTIKKKGAVIKLEGEEIEKLVSTLPRTFGGSY